MCLCVVTGNPNPVTRERRGEQTPFGSQTFRDSEGKGVAAESSKDIEACSPGAAKELGKAAAQGKPGSSLRII